MATDNQVLRIKKLVGKGIVRTAMKHNHREIQAEIGADSHIDPLRTRLNIVLAGAVTAGAVSDYADRLMLDAGVGPLRRDAVRGLEIIVSLPPASTTNQSAFFADALAWATSFYGLPVLSAVVHNDEATPHVHILLLPLIGGRMKGSDMMGGKARLQATQTSFYESVGRMYGLTRPKPPRRLNAATRAKSASLILTTLQADPALMDMPVIESALLTMIGRDPEPIFRAMGLTIPHPPKSKKTFVEIMTKPCKPEKPIGFASRSKPIGFDDRAAEKGQTLSCVGFAPPKTPIPAAKRVESVVLDADDVDPGDDYTRTRDDDHDAAQWDSDRGEYRHARHGRESATVLHGRSA